MFNLLWPFDLRFWKTILALNLIFNLQIEAAHLRSRCQNQYNDLGYCVVSDFCKTSNGINIGKCPNRGFSVDEICCYTLPCSDLEEFFHHAEQNSTSRKKRAILHDPTEPVQTKMDPFCGIRIENDFQQSRFSENQTPLRLVFHVNFDLFMQNLS